MKKIIALVFVFLYFFSSNMCFALSELYMIENSNKSYIESKIENVLTKKDYTIKKTNPYLALSNKNPGSNIIIVVEQSGGNLFYYFEANNDKEQKVNKAILKQFRKDDVSYSEYFNSSYMQYFSETAQNTILGKQKTYSFDTPQIKVNTQPTVQVKKEETSLKGRVMSVGKGTTINVYLQHAINTATARVGDSVTAVLKNNWVTRDSKVIAPQGSVLYGKLIEANSARRGLRNGNVQISFNKLVTPDGKTYTLSTDSIDFDVTNEGAVKSTVKEVAVASIIGGLAGLVLAATSDKNLASGAAIGAGIAGGFSLINNTAQKGIDAEIPAYTELDVDVLRNINIIINY